MTIRKLMQISRDRVAIEQSLRASRKKVQPPWLLRCESRESAAIASLGYFNVVATSRLKNAIL